MDYYIYDTVEEVNAKVVELIIEDKYNFLVIYNKNYDAKCISSNRKRQRHYGINLFRRKLCLLILTKRDMEIIKTLTL